MKKKLITIFLGLISGVICAVYLFNNNNITTVKAEEKVKITAFQIGVYQNYENARETAKKSNAIIIYEDNKYHVYIALANSNLTKNKLKEYYQNQGINTYQKQITISSTLASKITQIEEKYNSDVSKEMIEEIINTYEEEVNNG